MPGIYSKNKFDLAGFSVGIVSKKKLLHKKKVSINDVVLAYLLVVYIQMVFH